ncbi:MAG: transcription termination factor Rho [Phycisphaerae bacterium]|nr:transcription termination factor Rho [Phycisphaerae bacterium]
MIPPHGCAPPSDSSRRGVRRASGRVAGPTTDDSKEHSVPTGRSRRRRRRGGGHGGHGGPGAHGHGPSPGGQPGPGQHPQGAPAHQGSPNGHHGHHGSGASHGHGGHRAAPQIVIEGFDPATAPRPRPFEDLTSIDPQPRLTLEYPGCPDSCRLIDLFCPIGRGQRSLIVSPPKAGKTTLLKDIAGAIVRNHPDVQVIALLVDERPEEVTDFRRTFAAYGAREDGSPRGQVIASSNDHGVERHIAVSTGTMDLCKRMVEAGRHVVVVLDSLTRLGRAFNLSRKHASSGRTLSGGLDSRALEVPRQIFGSARNTEEAGSLTIIASVLVDTGSAQDQVIFEEFKGSGNMELILDRKISEKRLFPAINLAASGTRKEHLLMPEQELKTVTALRRRLIAMPPHVQVEQLLGAMKRFKTNAELVGSAG